MINPVSDVGVTLITLGALLLVGLATDFIGRRTPLPRVTLLLLFGFLLGPGGFDLLPTQAERWLPLIADMALLLVGFLLGGKLAFAVTHRNGRAVIWLSISEVIITAGVLAGGLWLLGMPLAIALLLAGIGTATDPAATHDVLNQTGARGPFSDTLAGVVAVDDAWGLIAFSVLLATAQTVTGQGQPLEILLHGAWELGGALLLGLALGIPMAYLSGRVRPGQPTLVEALGIVLLCGGLAQWLGVSFILAAMVLGVTVASLANHHERPFHAIEDIEWPFMILFFVLVGASLTLTFVSHAGWIGLAYIILRVIGRLLGSWPGGLLGATDPHSRRWLGLALLPQAGVAMGMALIAGERFPALAATLFPVVIAATVLFELIGPIFTRLTLIKSGETSNARSE